MKARNNFNFVTIFIDYKIQLIRIIFGDTNQKITYLYAATGQKMQKQVTQNSHTATTQYMGGYQYSNTRLQFFSTSEGYVKNTIIQGQNSYDYIYNLTDHLGNIRMSFGLDPKTQQLVKFEENNYYPFGLKHSRYNDQLREITEKQSYSIQLEDFITEKRSAQKTLAIPSNPDAEDIVLENSGYQYKYNGKEFQDELGLNMYDYGWRNYMPDVGRWMNIDPLLNDLDFKFDPNDIDKSDDAQLAFAIKTTLGNGGGIFNTDNLNPYSYGYNDPIRFDDPDGRCPSCLIGAAIGFAIEFGSQVAVNYAKGQSLKSSLGNVDFGKVAIATGVGAVTGGLSSLKAVGATAKVYKAIAGSAVVGAGEIAQQGHENGTNKPINAKKLAVEIVLDKAVPALINAGAKSLNKVEKAAVSTSTTKNPTASIVKKDVINAVATQAVKEPVKTKLNK